MFVLPQILADALSREREVAIERDLERRRLVALARAVADCCRRSWLARAFAALRLPLSGSRTTG